MTRSSSPPPVSGRPTIRISGADDTLAVVPLLLGFHPRRSIVVLALRPPRRRVAFAMRMDIDLLPAGPLAEEIARRLAHSRTRDVFVILYDPPPPAGTSTALPPVAGAELIDAVGARLADRDIRVREALGVAAGRSWSYLCADPACCPPEGRPVLGPADPGGPAAVGAIAAFAGLGALPDRETLERSVQPPTWVRREAMRQAIDGCELALFQRVTGGLDGVDLEAPEARRGVAERVDACRAETLSLLQEAMARWGEPGATMSDDEAARLIAGLQDVVTRDEVIVLGSRADRAGHDETDRLIAVLLELTRRAVPPHGAQVASALGMVAYQQGNGALAAVSGERALADNPDASCARLLTELINGQVHPREVRRQIRLAGRQTARQRR